MIHHPKSIAISIVSHRQAHMVFDLLQDVEKHCADHRSKVIVTVNVEENVLFSGKEFGFPIRIIRNAAPKGFGANHNLALRHEEADYFCILNPDIRLAHDPFAHLVQTLSDTDLGVAAPLVLNDNGKVEDSARCLPTPGQIILKVFSLGQTRTPDYEIHTLKAVFPDWVAGMFMLFPSEVFRQLRGFDERYFLYYEDVDICCRAWLAGYKVVLDPTTSVIHSASRDSHRKLKYLRWHLSSILRFFFSTNYRQCRTIMRRESSVARISSGCK